MKDLPNLSQKDYSIAYDDFERFCIQNTTAKVIGYFGEVKNPPISDLDTFICISDENFIRDREKIVSFIASDKVLSYVMEHMPVIIPQSLLPSLHYFHTMYNFTITYNVIDYIAKGVFDDYLKMLNLFWTFTIISRNYEKYNNINSAHKIRKELLLLKNLHQSAFNIANDQITVNYLERSSHLRDKYLIERHTNISTEIRNEVFRTRNDIVNMLNDINYPFLDNMRNNSKILKNRIRIKRNILIRRNIKVFIEANKCFMLSDNIYDLFLNLYNNKTNNKIVQLYLDEANKAKKICAKLKISFPFYVAPLGISPGKSDPKENLKRIILNCLDRLKII